jgi:hypothetical protein
LLLFATGGSLARIETRASAEPTGAKPAQVAVLDARTLRRAPRSWSLRLAPWSADQPSVLSPEGSRAAVVYKRNTSALIVDTTTGRIVRRVAETFAESIYWVRGEGVRKTSPAVVVEATVTCSGGSGPICGDDVDIVWTTDRRLEPGGAVIYNGFFVEAALRTSLVLTASEGPRTLVVWHGTPAKPADEPATQEITLSNMPESSQYAIAADVRNDRVFVVTNTGLVATIRRTSTRAPVVEYHDVELNGGSFSAAWAGSGHIALWGQDGLGTIDTRTWTTHAVADGVTGAVTTPQGIAAWTKGQDGVSVYRPDGSRRFHVLDGTRVTAARAIGAYLYADTDVDTRYSIDLRTGKTVGPLGTRARIIGPSFTVIP